MEAPVRIAAVLVEGFAVLLLLLRPGGIKAHECIHDTHIVPRLKAHPQHPHFTPQEDTAVRQGRRLGSVAERMQQRIAWANQTGRRLGEGFRIRIKPDYTYLDNDKYQCTAEAGHFDDVQGGKRSSRRCTADQVVNEEKRNHIKRLVEAAIAWWSKAIKVLHPTRGPLQLRKYCYQFAPPSNEDPSTKIVNECWRLQAPGHCNFQIEHVDFLLVVTATPTEGNTLAYALTCQSDELTRRPISGLVNFGPGRLSAKVDKWTSELSTAIHEIAHALGFSSSRYEDYIDDEGKPLGIEKVVRQFTNNGHKVTKVITPTVVKYTQKQFGCFDWPDAGAELEDYGGPGTGGSHWEKRIFRDEFMTGTDSLNPVYSSITLALFEDMGWYSADYGEAQFFHWGYQAGCAFPLQKCSRWEEKFFCSKKGQYSCTHNWYYKGFCNVVDYSEDIPVRHRYFGTLRKGGSDLHADFCPYYQGWVNQDCRAESSAENISMSIWGEEYGANSRCFESTVMRHTLDSGDKIQPKKWMLEPNPRCYKTFCEDGRLIVSVYGKKFSCPVDGGKIQEALGIPKFGGEIWCPAAYEVCNFDTVKSAPPEGMYSPADTNHGLVDVPELLPGSRAVTLDSSEAVYFFIAQTGDTGRLLLVTGGLLGATVYIRAMQEFLGRTSPKPEKGVRMPSADDNEFSAFIDKQGITIPLPRTLQDGGENMLMSIVPRGRNKLRGKVHLALECQKACANGGHCESWLDGEDCAGAYTKADVDMTRVKEWILRGCAGGGYIVKITYALVNQEIPSDSTTTDLVLRDEHNTRTIQTKQLSFPVSAGAVAEVWTTLDILPGNSRLQLQAKESQPLGNVVKLSIFKAAGYCQCKPGWTGVACEDRQCPKDCSGNGDCNTAQGFCTCQVGYKGEACSEKDVVASPSKGEVEVGQWAYFWIGCGDTDQEDVGADYLLQYTLNKVVPDAAASDPIVYARKGKAKPTVSTFGKRDLHSWKSSETVHELELRVRAGIHGGATIGVYNTAAYATKRLKYTGRSKCVPINDKHEGCPATERGRCNGKGDCRFSQASKRKTCFCQAGWMGEACDTATTLGREVVLHEKTYYTQIVVDNSKAGQQLVVALKGLKSWVGISMNRGTRRPDPANPRACDFHNYFDNLKVAEMPKLRIGVVDSSVYTVMVRNTVVKDAKFIVEVTYEEKPQRTGAEAWPVDVVSDEIARDEGQDEPGVPQDMIGTDGSLPRAVLIISSRTGVQGVASSKEMILIKVEEFCSQTDGPTGLLYARCSNIRGTMTICTERAAKVFYHLRSVIQPKETTDFKYMELTNRGAPEKFWSHLPAWQDNCRYHTKVKIDAKHYYVGVSALEQGAYVNVIAVMRGESGLFFNDQGEVHWFYLHAGTFIFSSLTTAGVLIGAWYWRKHVEEKRQKEAKAVDLETETGRHERFREEVLSNDSEQGRKLSESASASKYPADGFRQGGSKTPPSKTPPKKGKAWPARDAGTTWGPEGPIEVEMAPLDSIAEDAVMRTSSNASSMQGKVKPGKRRDEDSLWCDLTAFRDEDAPQFSKHKW